MAKIAYPSTTALYRGHISPFRTVLDNLAAAVELSPGLKAEVAAQFQAFLNEVGGTDLIISSGTEFLGPAITGTRTNGYTPTIVAGAVTVLTGS